MKFRSIAALAILSASLTPALAQTSYPTRPIRIMVGFSAGGSTDVLARVAAQEARKTLGQDLIVVNKPGAAATIAMADVANADPDGYTIGITPSGVMTMTPLFQNVRSDLLDVTSALVVAGRQRTGLAVKSDSPLRSVKDLLAAARENPGKISIGTPGVGTGVAVLLQAIIIQEKSDISLVPMQGDAPVVQAMMGGHVSAGTTSAAGFAEHIRAGTMRLLASMDNERLDVAPDVPTLIEQGYDLYSGTLQYFMAPKKTPADIKAKLIDALTKAVNSPAFVEIAKQNVLHWPTKMTGEELDAYFQKDRQESIALVKRLGLGKDSAK